MRRLHHTVGWPPIDVYAVGGLYFVEDGHHRVSVARAAGLATIEARVHEFPVAVTLAPGISLRGALARLRAATARPAPHPAPLAAGCEAVCAA